MDILDVCITGIVSEEELNRVVRVTIDTDCWGATAYKITQFATEKGLI